VNRPRRRLDRWNRPFVLALAMTAALASRPATADDRIAELQEAAVARADEPAERAFHFGSQGPGDVFSNHTSHTNRLVPVWTYGRPLDLGRITGARSPYRDAEAIEALYGRLPERTLNPEADYGDQSDLARVLERAVENGARHVFILLFDGLDGPTVRAASLARTGVVEPERPDHGLRFAEIEADGAAQVGAVVTSPSHASGETDVDQQTVRFADDVVRGGYDAEIAGPDPWRSGSIDAPTYLLGQSANEEQRAALRAAGGAPHAYTDSAASATEIVTGVKTYNGSINVGPDGAFLEPLFQKLQRDGWKVGTVSSVPFNHASPASMYARNVSRNDYQDLARDMLGLPNIATERGAPRLPGLDVVIGTGFGIEADLDSLKPRQGANAVGGNVYIAAADLEAIDADRSDGGRYVVAQRTASKPGAEMLRVAAARASAEGLGLFGFFGTSYGHLPYQTTDGGFDPVPGYDSEAETYSDADRIENPTLAEMTASALTVLGADRATPFALFVEAGDVDWALHDNNLDNAIGALYSGEEALEVIAGWVAGHSAWDETAVIVTSDHGHYLVIDDPEAIAEAAR